MQVGVHARLEHRDAPELLELGGVGVVAEGAGDQHVEAGVGGLARSRDQVGPRDGAELRANEDACAARGALLAAPLHIAPLGADIVAGPGRERGEFDAVLPVRLLHTRRPEVLQDHLGEIRRLAVAQLLVGEGGEELVVLVHRQHPVRRQAFDREGAGDADARGVGIGLVVEILVVCLGGDGGVDGLLTGDARLPPLGVRGCGVSRPVLAHLARDFPFLPSLAEGGVEPGAERLQGLLPALPDHVDLGVVGDGFEGDVRHALVDEALADVTACRRFRRRALRDLGFLLLPLGTVGEQIPGVARAHDPRPRQRERHAGGVDGDPAPAPLLRHVGRGAGAAGRGRARDRRVGGHQDAAFDDRTVCLDDIDFWVGETRRYGINPQIRMREYAEVF